MYPQQLFVQKTTGTPSDTQVAYGLAKFIDGLVPEDEELDLKIEDLGDSYGIVFKYPLKDAWVEQAQLFHLLRPLDTAKKSSGLPNPVDYVGHQRRNSIYFEARKKGLKENDLAEQGISPPPSDWPSWAIINQMAATSGYNTMIANWHEHQACFPELAKIILLLFGDRANGIEVAEEKWKALAKAYNLKIKPQTSQLQVINPGMGKGGNKSKANGLSIGGLNGFWLVEYLKFVGLFNAAIPRVVSNSKDRKTYVLRPKSLDWKTHSRVFADFQTALYAQTPVKMDVLAALRYCQVFLKQWKAGQSEGKFHFLRGQPGDHVAAIETIHYKHLGSAHATMNLSSINLPQWLGEVENIAQADQFLDMLTEHETILRNLEEKKSREYSLLRHYRDFLSARDLRAFYRFTAIYAGHVISKLVEGGAFPPRRFHVSNLEVLIVNHNPKLAEIVHNPGFRRIAEAIRKSTVTPQWYKYDSARKSQPNPNPFEIRYGLGSDLLRNASYPKKFLQALGKFLFEYNQENGRVNERFKGAPPVRRINIRTEDIEDVSKLIDEYRGDSETIANLLVAFGYASDPRNRNDEDEPDDVEANNAEVNDKQAV